MTLIPLAEKFLRDKHHAVTNTNGTLTVHLEGHTYTLRAEEVGFRAYKGETPLFKATPGPMLAAFRLDRCIVEGISYV